MINNNNLYLIKWIDSYNFPSTWESIEEMEDPIPLVCVSVGWIEKETDEYIVLIPHISDIDNKDNKGMGCGSMGIPKIAILERINLKYKQN
ncbi:MAG: hypothetical protein H8E34_10430 [Bacteroidetes bacterium]|nr:hypothetical protein [Bacteroidota bacterium]